MKPDGHHADNGGAGGNGITMEDLSTSRILIVEDTRTNIHVLVSGLKRDYRVSVAINGEGALAYLERHVPDLILLDVMMPEMDGFELCSRLKADDRTRDIPIIFLTAMHDTKSKGKGFELGAVDYITKPFDMSEVRARVRTHLMLKKSTEALQQYNKTLEVKVRERTLELFERAVELKSTQLEIVYRLGRAAEFRDNETGFHIRRISHFCSIIAKAAGMAGDAVELLFQTSPMHDIGKLGIPDHILLKPGRLEPAEMQSMRRHTVIGAEILAGHNSRLLQMARIIALTHHEQWNGSGYPEGLAGEAIPIEGRITGLCDVFDALTSVRPYKKAWTVEETVAEIRRQSGRHFDPRLVRIFNEVLPDLLTVRQTLLEPE